MRTRRAVLAAMAAGAMIVIAGCSGSGAAGSTGAPPQTRTLGPGAAAGSGAGATPGAAGDPGSAWPAYGGNPRRTNVASAAPAGPLSIAWRTRLDGAVYGQPLLVGGLVIAATENDSVYGLAAATGRVVWRTRVGTPVPLADLPCGDIDPLGITGTPAYDPADGLVYAVAETAGYHHVLVGVSAASGAVKVERDIPTPDGQPRYDQQRPALAIEDGRVYVAFGGLYGDCGPYRGSLVGVPVTGNGPLISYVVPTAREGAIWGTAGPVTGTGGTLYVSTGNGADSSTSFDGSDAVTALSPTLQRTGIFAPVTWHEDSQADADLGSAQPALLSDGTILADGKRSTAYLLNASHLGGVGGQITEAQVCDAYGGTAVTGTTVYEPCADGGIAAVSAAGNQIHVLWRGPASAAGSPVVGGGAVWVIDYSGGTLYQLNPATGAPVRTLSLGTPLPHFASMSMSGTHAYIGTNAGVTAVSGA
jgi:outer membrane protein assembly factor BamB